jgi:hypothetical protein
MVPLAAERVMRFRNTTRFHLHLHPLSPLWPRCQLLMRHPTCSDEPERLSGMEHFFLGFMAAVVGAQVLKFLLAAIYII